MYNLGRPHAGAKILLYHAAAILSIVISHKRKMKFIPEFVILPLVIRGQIWYTIIVPREGAKSRPPKKVFRKSKKPLDKTSNLWYNKYTVRERKARERSKDFSKLSKKVLDKPPKLWYNIITGKENPKNQKGIDTMANKKMKKINPKDTAKKEIMEVISKALAAAGYDVTDGEDYAMTKGTIVAHHATCDVQIKPITPKAGVDRYEIVEDEEG